MSRTSLARIDPNSIKRKELSPFLRGKIFAKHSDGLSAANISRDLGIPRTTIWSTLQRESTQLDGKSFPRPGRPKSYTERDKRHILTIIKRNPFITYQAIREQSGLNLSSATFLRILKESGYGH